MWFMLTSNGIVEVSNMPEQLIMDDTHKLYVGSSGPILQAAFEVGTTKPLVKNSLDFRETTKNRYFLVKSRAFKIIKNQAKKKRMIFLMKISVFRF